MTSEHEKLLNECREQIKKEVKEKNKIYDPAFEAEIKERLERLGQPYIDSFYSAKENREDDKLISNMDRDLLLIKQLEDSYAFDTKHNNNINSFSLSDVKNVKKRTIKLNDKEIHLLKYVLKKSTDLKYLPKYFTFDYKLKIGKSMLKLFTNDYLYISFADSFALGKYKVNYLKGVLDKYNLSNKGKKDVLVDRLLSNLSTEQLEKDFPDKYFLPTSKGIEFLNSLDEQSNQEVEQEIEVDITNLPEKFYNALKNKVFQNTIFNFVLSAADTTVAFINSNKPYHSIIAVMDSKFNILFNMVTDAYIGGCNISKDGTLITFYTHNSKGNCSNSIFLVNVTTGEVLFKIEKPPIKATEVCCYVFDDFIEYIFEDVKIKYDFTGKDLRPENTKRSIKKSKYVDPYYFNNMAMNLIDKLNNNFDDTIEQEIMECLNISQSNSNMSKYQLALTYKKLGECYIKYNYKDKALSFFEKGVELYPKLGVNKIINQIKSELS